MMSRNICLMTMVAAASISAGCKTVPQPLPEPDPVTIEVETRTCIAPEKLERRVIPAVMKRGFYITGVQDEPQYVTDPETGEVKEIPVGTENKVPYERVITPEQILWINENGQVVTDICLPEGETPESYIPGE